MSTGWILVLSSRTWKRLDIMVVIGLTGKMGSGKTTVRHFLEEAYNCEALECSEILEDAKEGTIGRRGLQEVENAGNIINERTVEKINDYEDDIYVLSGIRPPDQVDFLRDRYGENFRLVHLKADEPERYVRIEEREDNKDDFDNYYDFLEEDFSEVSKYNMLSTFAQADYILETGTNLQELYENIEEVINEIFVEQAQEPWMKALPPAEGLNP